MPISIQILILGVIGSAAYALYLNWKAKASHKGSHAEPHHSHGHDEPQHQAPVHHEAPLPTLAPALSETVKVVVYVPDAHADEVRQAIGQAGAGRIGNYSFCTFSSLGTGRYLPGAGANPMVGTVGVHEKVEEERIEFTCDRQILSKVVATIKKVHPYEEIIIDIYPLEAHPEPEPVHSH